MRKFRLATATVACFSPAALAAPNALVAVNEDGAFFCQDPDALSIAGNEAEKQRLRRPEDDHCTARPSYPPLRYRRDRQRQLALQEPRLTPYSPATRACTGGSTGSPRAPLRKPRHGRSATRGSPLWTTGTSRSLRGQFWTPIKGQYSTPIDNVAIATSSARTARRIIGVLRASWTQPEPSITVM